MMKVYKLAYRYEPGKSNSKIQPIGFAVLDPLMLSLRLDVIEEIASSLPADPFDPRDLLRNVSEYTDAILRDAVGEVSPDLYIIEKLGDNSFVQCVGVHEVDANSFVQIAMG